MQRDHKVRANEGFLAINPQFTIEVTTAENGDIALLNSQWQVTGTDPEGNAVSMSGNGSEVVRRQADGSWKFIIDNPGGE